MNDYQERVLAMPYLADATDFGLGMGREDVNREIAHRLLKSDPEVIRDLGDGVKLYKVGRNIGYLFLYNPHTDLIGYYMNYREQKKSLIGHKVTQTKVWRSMEEEKASGVTNWVVFDYLLKTWPAIMSDRMQTQNGKDFWIRLMFFALNRGHKVVLTDLNLKNVEEISLRSDLRLLITNPPEDNPWGKMLKHQAMRFAILAK